ncbi:MAG: inositol monophosphatase [Fidelibacterota bacterium]|nr:MAG: inositol monophosphatase [Candidatus Neomarinimicrobiota bacterium]
MVFVSPDPQKALEVGLAAAREAGELLVHKFRRLESIQKKGSFDLVTEADLASEQVIVSTLKHAFPDHAIIAEEKDYARESDSPCRWVIDPLDGTTNYVHGLPLFAVSIGYQVDQETVAAVVLNPLQGEEYVAVKGEGTTLNGEPIQVSSVNDLENSLLVTGFPYHRGDEQFDQLFDLYRVIHHRCQGVRRLGAAALDFCFVAAGRIDAFYEANLNPWDVCAGDLICREAGGRTTDWHGSPMPDSGHRVVASNGLVHDELLDILVQPEFDGL